MAKGRQSMADAAAALARQLHLALLRERIVRRFADSYVLENERQALQAHAVMYRDLLALLDREALLALSVRALEIVCDEPRAQGRSKPRPMARREAALFHKKFLASLVRQQGWSVGDALDFQKDLQLYEDLLARTAPPGALRNRSKRRIILLWTAAHFCWTPRSSRKRAWPPAARWQSSKTLPSRYAKPPATRTNRCG